MSALYMGTGKLERYLVERLDNKLQTNKTLKMNILMDYMRGTRVSRDGHSSLSMLKGLKQKHLMRDLRIGFWHNPDTGFLKGKYFSGPMKEIFGVHHIKAHVFDHNVIITGANLSEDYFTDRQDRCYIIQDCEPLANYFEDLISLCKCIPIIL
jgi:CDP-diacylglycerol---glycerol-3-phosphate 3-phosphatidyltransferase